MRLSDRGYRSVTKQAYTDAQRERALELLHEGADEMMNFVKNAPEKATEEWWHQKLTKRGTVRSIGYLKSPYLTPKELRSKWASLRAKMKKGVTEHHSMYAQVLLNKMSAIQAKIADEIGTRPKGHKEVVEHYAITDAFGEVIEWLE